MKEEDNLRKLGLRIKLFRRHLSEWNNLLIYQRESRHLIREESGCLPICHDDDEVDRIMRMIKQEVWLTQLAIRQSEERQQIRYRHQQEECELEDVLTKLIGD